MHQYKLISSDAAYKDLTVLIVDDFDAITRSLYMAFESLGFKNILKAKDGKEALYRLENNTVDIIVSDWKMPKIDGLQLLKRVRKMQAYKHVPFVMLTGNLHQSDVIEAIEAGVSEYLTKPFSLAKLTERIHKAFVSPIPSSAISRLKKESKPEEKTDKRRSILIVDDDPINLQVLGELLKNDYKTRVCRSGRQAIDICSRDDKPDLILLDIMMPDMDGIATCRELKSNPETKFIPIIFVSALSQTNDVVKGLKLGAVDYITKPIIPEIVHARVQTHVNSVIQREKMTKQLDHLIEAVRVHDDVNQTFCHDLCNPLTAMLSTISIMQQKTPELTQELELLKDSSKMMLAMLNNYNLLTQLELGTFNKPLTEVKVNQIIHRVVDSFSAKARQKNIEIKLDIAPTHIYLGDEMLSYTMYSNLITNAIQAAPENTCIQIKSEQQADEIVISIFNRGEVPLKIRGQFFNKFVTDGKEDGMGIGAYSAKLAAQAQNGRIKLSIAVDAGTTLIVYMKVPDSNNP